MAALRAELEMKNKKLSKYAIIERQLEIVGDEDHALIMESLEEMSRKHLAAEQFPSIIIRKAKEIEEERLGVLEQLSHMMLEIAVPYSFRLCLWEAENNIKTFDTAYAEKLLGCKPDAEQMKALLSWEDWTRSYKKEYEKMRMRTISASKEIRRNVKQIVECQQGIQVEMLGLLRHYKSTFLGKYTKDNAERDTKFAPKLRQVPELSNAAIFQLSHKGLWMDTTASVYLDADDATECGDKSDKIDS